MLQVKDVRNLSFNRIRFELDCKTVVDCNPKPQKYMVTKSKLGSLFPSASMSFDSIIANN